MVTFNVRDTFYLLTLVPSVRFIVQVVYYECNLLMTFLCSRLASNPELVILVGIRVVVRLCDYTVVVLITIGLVSVLCLILL